MSGIHTKTLQALAAGAVFLLLQAVWLPAWADQHEAGVEEYAAAAVELESAAAGPTTGTFRASMGFSAVLDGSEFGDVRFTYTKLSGVLINSADGGFMHQSRMQCSTVNDNGFVFGYCAVTDEDGDAFYLMIQRATAPDTASGGDGEMLLMSGTGKYTGITGAASFAVDYEPTASTGNAQGMMVVEGSYELR